MQYVQAPFVLVSILKLMFPLYPFQLSVSTHKCSCPLLPSRSTAKLCLQQTGDKHAAGSGCIHTVWWFPVGYLQQRRKLTKRICSRNKISQGIYSYCCFFPLNLKAEFNVYRYQLISYISFTLADVVYYFLCIIYHDFNCLKSLHWPKQATCILKRLGVFGVC